MDMPNSPEAEAGLIASILRRTDQFEHLYDQVKPADFSWNCYSWAWEAMYRLHERGLIIDAVTLGDQLEQDGKLGEFCLSGSKQFNGRAAISRLRDIQTSRDGAESYALAVNDSAVKRRLIQVASHMATWAYNGRTSAAIVADVERTLGELVIHSGKVAARTFEAVAMTTLSSNATDRAMKGKKAVQFGLIDLDRLTKGLQRTNLYIIASRPGLGKSSFLLTVLKNAALVGKRGLLFSVEMSTEQVGHRLLAQIAKIDVACIIGGEIGDDDWNAYYRAVDDLQTLPIVVNDTPAIRLSQLRQVARREHAKSPLDLILVDYIQIMVADGKHDRRDQEIGEITAGLKALAKELDIPILAAAQLSRAVETRGDKFPILSDLRESGNIEQDADVVMFIYHPDPYNSKNNSAQIVVAKQRNGAPGVADVAFLGHLTRFENAHYQEIK